MEKKTLISLFGYAVVGALSAFAVGCDSDENPDTGKPAPGTSADSAIADLQPKSGTTVEGKGTFTADGKMITLTVALKGAKAGQHAVHIHEFGDCSAADALSAGGHWNPLNNEHGRLGSAKHHMGDIGNISIDDSGKGTLTVTTEEWAIGTGGANDVVGKALVVHADADDFATQPDGHAGTRVACGVIQED